MSTCVDLLIPSRDTRIAKAAVGLSGESVTRPRKRGGSLKTRIRKTTCDFTSRCMARCDSVRARANIWIRATRARKPLCGTSLMQNHGAIKRPQGDAIDSSWPAAIQKPGAVETFPAPNCSGKASGSSLLCRSSLAVCRNLTWSIHFATCGPARRGSCMPPCQSPRASLTVSADDRLALSTLCWG